MLSDTIHLLDVNWDNETRNNENRKSYQQFIVFHSLCTMYKSSIMRYLAKWGFCGTPGTFWNKLVILHKAILQSNYKILRKNNKIDLILDICDKFPMI